MWTKLKDLYGRSSCWSVFSICLAKDMLFWLVYKLDWISTLSHKETLLGFPLVGFALAAGLNIGVSCLIVYCNLYCCSIVNGWNFSCIIAWWLEWSKEVILYHWKQLSVWKIALVLLALVNSTWCGIHGLQIECMMNTKPCTIWMSPSKWSSCLH